MINKKLLSKILGIKIDKSYLSKSGKHIYFSTSSCVKKVAFSSLKCKKVIINYKECSIHLCEYIDAIKATLLSHRSISELSVRYLSEKVYVSIVYTSRGDSDYLIFSKGYEIKAFEDTLVWLYKNES